MFLGRHLHREEFKTSSFKGIQNTVFQVCILENSKHRVSSLPSHFMALESYYCKQRVTIDLLLI